jgi:transcriptional regulator with XRE-family HTH domain
VIDYIRNQIKKRRVEKRLTQSDMAIDLGITPGAYSKIESGPTEITVKKLAAIAAILEVDMTYFFQKYSSISKVEEPNRAIGYATKADIEEITHAIKKMQHEITNLKAAMPIPAASRRKKKA